MDSILTSIKKLLGIGEEDTAFDMDITIHINSALMILTQLGVGPPNGFTIEDKDDLWSDFISPDDKSFESVKTYMYLKVKLVFDPPPSSAVIEVFNKNIKELECRLRDAADSK